MENFFSRLTLDIIGKAVFNYDFDSLTHDDPVIQVQNCSANCSSPLWSSSASMRSMGLCNHACIRLIFACFPSMAQVEG